ncbi:MAG: hypothetical protein RR621_03450 [Lachnospiraceae bacterium]
MFIKWKNDIKQVIKILKEHYIWLLCYTVGIIGISFWITRSAMSMWEFYHFEGSIVDLVLFTQNPWNCGILIMPVTMLMIQKINAGQFEGQHLIRHITRKSVWGKRWRFSAILAIFFSTVLIVIHSLIGRLFLGTWMNWSQPESLFYAYTGKVLEGGFIRAGFIIYIMYFLKILLDASLLACISWNKRGKLFFWVFIVIQSGMELRLDGLPIFYQFFKVTYEVWVKNEVIGVKVLVGVFALAVMWMIGRVVTEKKDFMYE